jgi:hypothetical protein
MNKLQRIVGAALLVPLGGFLAAGIVGVAIHDGKPPSPDPSQASDASPISTDLFSTAQFSGVPASRLAAAREGLQALLSACPRIARSAENGEKLSIYWYPEGWEATPAHLDVEMNLTEVSLADLPRGLRDPQWGGHVEIGLSAGRTAGAIMEMPLPEWLCGVPVDDDILSSAKRDWAQEKLLVPIPRIRPGSF